MRGWVGSRADMDVNVEKKNLLSPRAGQGHVSAQGRSLIQRPPLIVCRHFKPINFFGWGQGWNSFWQRVSKLLIIFGEILSRVETWAYEHCISDRYSDISVPLSPGLLASAGIWSLERSASSEKPYPLPYCSSNVHSRWYFVASCQWIAEHIRYCWPVSQFRGIPAGCLHVLVFFLHRLHPSVVFLVIRPCV